MSDQRLFGVPGAEDMHFDLASAYEAQIDPYADEHDRRPREIEEWSVCPATSHLPTVDNIIEWASEWAADNGMLDEYGSEDTDNAARHPTVIEAFQAAVDLWASRINYRMADRCLQTHAITWDADGDPLADGVPIYGKASATGPRSQKE